MKKSPAVREAAYVVVGFAAAFAASLFDTNGDSWALVAVMFAILSPFILFEEE